MRGACRAARESDTGAWLSGVRKLALVERLLRKRYLSSRARRVSELEGRGGACARRVRGSRHVRVRIGNSRRSG